MSLLKPIHFSMDKEAQIIENAEYHNTLLNDQIMQCSLEENQQSYGLLKVIEGGTALHMQTIKRLNFIELVICPYHLEEMKPILLHEIELMNLRLERIERQNILLEQRVSALETLVPDGYDVPDSLTQDTKDASDCMR